MVQAYPKSNRVSECIVFDRFGDCLNMVLIAAKEQLWLFVASGVAYYVEGRQPCLPTRCYEYQRRVVRGMLLNSGIARLVHCGHSGIAIGLARQGLGRGL
jgi:hypothetical protein